MAFGSPSFTSPVDTATRAASGPFYALGEYNVQKRGADDFLLISISGAEVTLDRETALAALALHSQDRVEALASLEPHLPPERAAEAVDNLVPALAEIGLLTIEAKRPGDFFDTAQALRNVDELPSGPLTLQELAITPSGQCPMACGYCFRDDQKVKGGLTIEDIRPMLRDLARLAGRTLNISGGEPVTFAALVTEIAREATALGITRVSVNTTGFGLTDKIATEWRDAGISCFNFSLDTMVAEKNDLMYDRRGAWQRTIEAIRRVDAIGGSDDRPPVLVHLNCTLYGENADQIEPIAALTKSLRNGLFRVNPYVPVGRTALVSPVIFSDAAHLVKRLKAAGHPIYSPLDPDARFPEYLICSAGLTRATVEPDGSVGGCLFLGKKFGPHGNAKEEGLLSLWTRGDWSTLRDIFPTIPRVCRDCKLRFACVGSCAAHALGLTGNAKMDFGEGDLDTFECPYKIPEITHPSMVAGRTIATRP